MCAGGVHEIFLTIIFSFHPNSISILFCQPQKNLIIYSMEKYKFKNFNRWLKHYYFVNYIDKYFNLYLEAVLHTFI